MRSSRTVSYTHLDVYKRQLWGLINRAEEPGDDRVEPTAASATASGIARTTAAHHPAHLRLASQDRVQLPTSEGRIWSLFGGASSRDESGFAGDVLSSVVLQLLRLQPEAAGHLRCLAWGPGAADPVSYTHLDVYKRQVVGMTSSCGSLRACTRLFGKPPISKGQLGKE